MLTFQPSESRKAAVGAASRKGEIMTPVAGLPSSPAARHGTAVPRHTSHHSSERQSQVCQIFHVIVFLNFVMVWSEGSGGTPGVPQRAAAGRGGGSAGRAECRLGGGTRSVGCFDFE